MKEATARVVTATEARTRLGELMRDVATHRHVVVVERGGKPQVVILSVGDYEQLKRRAPGEGPHWRELASRSRERIRGELGGRTLPASEDIVRRDREERDGRSPHLH